MDKIKSDQINLNIFKILISTFIIFIYHHETLIYSKYPIKTMLRDT
jgi:hypothetical protein